MGGAPKSPRCHRDVTAMSPRCGFLEACGGAGGMDTKLSCVVSCTLSYGRNTKTAKVLKISEFFGQN